MKSQKIDYYETLELTRKASQQEIKQSYKRLALIHHPDKNEGTEESKLKFRQISEAYTVLNDPKKRDNYDKYGVADLEGMDFEQFMGSFQGFDEFLNQFLSFNTFQAMFSGMDKKRSKKAPKARGRAKGRQKNTSSKEMNELAKLMMMGGLGGDTDLDGDMEMAMLQAMMAGGMLDPDELEQMMEKQIQKMVLQSEDQDEEEDQDLTAQQMQILQFGQKNIQKKKVGKKKKKTEIKCKLDGQKIEEDQILMHFSEKHMNQFRKWQQTNKKQPIKVEAKEKSQQKNKEEEQIQY